MSTTIVFIDKEILEIDPTAGSSRDEIQAWYELFKETNIGESRESWIGQ
jgi:hypothetical protein